MDGDTYNPIDRFKGNSRAWAEYYEDPENFSITDNAVEWNTTEDNDRDLRIWYLDMADDQWDTCRIQRYSHVSGKGICYTTEALRHA